jgi:hypothetical protein
VTGGSAEAADPVLGPASRAVPRQLRPSAAAVLASATRWTLARPDAWPVALVAFLARGGVLIIALPFLVLPTPIGIAAWVGADAISADGPTARLLVLAAVAALAVGGAVVLGAVVAAASDRSVLSAWAADSAVEPPQPRGAVVTVARVVAIRVAAAIPPAIAVAWAVPRLADAVYRQLTLPDDLASPLALRVVAMAPEAVLAIALGLLVGELLAGPATVHAVVGGDGAMRALVRVPGDLFRRPVAVLGAYLAGVGLLVAGVGIPLAAGVAAWDLARRSLAAGSAPLPAAAAVLVFVGALVGALAVAGAVAAWRRASMAGAVADPARDPGRRPAGA